MSRVLEFCEPTFRDGRQRPPRAQPGCPRRPPNPAGRRRMRLELRLRLYPSTVSRTWNINNSNVLVPARDARRRTINRGRSLEVPPRRTESGPRHRRQASKWNSPAEIHSTEAPGPDHLHGSLLAPSRVAHQGRTQEESEELPPSTPLPKLEVDKTLRTQLVHRRVLLGNRRIAQAGAPGTRPTRQASHAPTRLPPRGSHLPPNHVPRSWCRVPRPSQCDIPAGYIPRCWMPSFGAHSPNSTRDSRATWLFERTQ